VLAGTQSLELNYAEVQSFTAHKPFLMTASAFGLGKKKEFFSTVLPIPSVYHVLFFIFNKNKHNSNNNNTNQNVGQCPT